MIKSILRKTSTNTTACASLEMGDVLFHSKEYIFAASAEDSALLFANEQWRKYHSLTTDEPVDKIRIIDISPVVFTLEKWEEVVERVKASRNGLDISLTSPMPLNPELEAVTGTLYYQPDRKEPNKGVIWGFGRDNTAFILHEQESEHEIEELKEAKEKAENSNHNKSAFLANMSHEIRTPLNAIVGFSRIIAESEREEDRKSYYEMVSSNSERLLQLINEILDLSKMEAGRIEFVIAPVSLHQMCREVYEAHVFRCPEEVKLIFEPSDEQIRISTDKNRIIQVLSNLIGNAFKFTTHGSISFGYQRAGKMVEFHVTDTGAGIAPEKIDTVFDRFVKATSTVQGTGLGLSICKTIVEKLGGDISVASEQGKQTTFTFTLPNKLDDENEGMGDLFDLQAEVQRELQNQEATQNREGVQAQGERTSDAPAAPQTGTTAAASTQTPSSPTPSDPTQPSDASDSDEMKTVLVAEDENYNYILVKAILSKKYNLVHANNGMEAVNMFSDANPDVILMDMRMPQMGGLDATRIIRELSPTVPIIAFTAFAFEQDKQNAYEAGCNDFLTKPFKQEDLLDIIAKWANRR
jgi:signal transduction histidine kinase/CheY-like chemotaxis protein